MVTHKQWSTPPGSLGKNELNTDLKAARQSRVWSPAVVYLTLFRKIKEQGNKYTA